MTLDSNPSDAPCCVKVIADDGRDVLFQTDWDWPSVASVFGFRLKSVQKCAVCGEISTGLTNWVVKYCHSCQQNTGDICSHDATDGTINCKCGVTASDFICAARDYLNDNDGAQAEDPGYFVNP